MTSENISSGPPIGGHMHLVDSWVDCDSDKQGSLCLTVPALRGVCHNGSQSLRGLCYLNIQISRH